VPGGRRRANLMIASSPLRRRLGDVSRRRREPDPAPRAVPGGTGPVRCRRSRSPLRSGGPPPRPRTPLPSCDELFFASAFHRRTGPNNRLGGG